MNNTQLDIWPPFRLVGMSWTLILIIFFLPNQTWAFVIKILLGLGVLIIIRASLQPLWDEYKTMGAFVTMQILWFIGILWTPEQFWYIHLLFSFLIVLGIRTKIHQINHINKGLGADLSKS